MHMNIKVTVDGILRKFEDVRETLDFVLGRCLNCSRQLSKTGGLFCRECYRKLTASEKRKLVEKHRGRIIGIIEA